MARSLKDVDYKGNDNILGRLFKNKEECKMKLAIHAIIENSTLSRQDPALIM